MLLLVDAGAVVVVAPAAVVLGAAVVVAAAVVEAGAAVVLAGVAFLLLPHAAATSNAMAATAIVFLVMFPPRNASPHWIIRAAPTALVKADERRQSMDNPLGCQAHRLSVRASRGRKTSLRVSSKHEGNISTRFGLALCAERPVPSLRA